MSREEILADFQVFLATDKDILYLRFSTYLIASSPCLKYIIWHSQVPEKEFESFFVWSRTLCNLTVTPNVLPKKYTNQMAPRTVVEAIVQACTGIDDFGIALHHLEEANWVLMVSFQK